MVEGSIFEDVEPPEAAAVCVLASVPLDRPGPNFNRPRHTSAARTKQSRIRRSLESMAHAFADPERPVDATRSPIRS